MLHPGVGQPAVRAMEPSATSPYTMERQGGLLSLLCGMSALVHERAPPFAPHGVCLHEVLRKRSGTVPDRR